MLSVRNPLKRLSAVRPQTQWHLLLLFPWFIPLLTYWLLGDDYLNDARTFLLATGLNLGIGVTCLLTLDHLTQWVIRHYPNLGQTWSRVWRLLTVFVLVTPVFILGAIYAYDHYRLFGYSLNPFTTARIMLINLGANLLSVGVDEMVYSMGKLREVALEKEQLKKINLQRQFESLKNQVNPHFLFNTLNSLSSLIADEPLRAEQFVNEMSKVYRYLLQTNEGELTTLATELQFLDSYYHLLKTRYGAGIHLDVGVPTGYEQHLLPPLTLQMLVENAVKHNVIQANRPLCLELRIGPVACPPGSEETDGACLLIRNNLQRRNNRIVSNQVGLTNIAAKYRLLAQAEPVVRDDDGYFTVVLPLLSPVSA